MSKLTEERVAAIERRNTDRVLRELISAWRYGKQEHELSMRALYEKDRRIDHLIDELSAIDAMLDDAGFPAGSDPGGEGILSLSDRVEQMRDALAEARLRLAEERAQNPKAIRRGLRAALAQRIREVDSA